MLKGIVIQEKTLTLQRLYRLFGGGVLRRLLFVEA